MNILITGTTSGLGEALANVFRNAGHDVYALNRDQCDLSKLECIESALGSVLSGVERLDYVFLNAGILGRLTPTDELTLDEFNEAFNINVFSNKVILDWLLKNCKVKNVIGISSGAALKSYFGWSLYCCSKAAFKQLLATYAEEVKETHFLSLAPGIIKTKMQDYIYSLDEKDLPSIVKFKKMYNDMDSPDVVANRIFNNLDLLKSKPSGSYFDMRDV